MNERWCTSCHFLRCFALVPAHDWLTRKRVVYAKFWKKRINHSPQKRTIANRDAEQKRAVVTKWHRPAPQRESFILHKRERLRSDAEQKRAVVTKWHRPPPCVATPGVVYFIQRTYLRQFPMEIKMQSKRTRNEPRTCISIRKTLPWRQCRMILRFILFCIDCLFVCLFV